MQTRSEVRIHQSALELSLIHIFQPKEGGEIAGDPTAHRRNACGQSGDTQHLRPDAVDGAHVALQNAPVHNAGHQGGDEQRAHHLPQQQHKGQGHLAPVPQEKLFYIAHGEPPFAGLVFFSGKGYHKP